MTETYYIDRDYHGDVTLWRENEPDDKYPLAVTIDPELIDLLRSLGVEDRTQPDWSHIEPGTAGTATVSGTSLVDGPHRGMKTENGFFIVVDGDVRFVDNKMVTDFTPDVVVDKALFDAVSDAIINTSLTVRDERVAIAAAHRALRGES